MSTKQAVPTTACGTPEASGAFVVTMLVCFPLTAHEAMGASRVRRSARPLEEGGDAEGFGRPRADITTGVMVHV